MPKDKLPDKDFKFNSLLAYAIGLLTTDGSLSKDGRHITLVSTDLPLLRAFKNCLPFSTKITNKLPGGFSKKRTYKIQFGNVQFYRWLLKIGLFPNKTYTISDLKIPDKYFRDFLRGHLDGDGDIQTYIDDYNIYKNKRYAYRRLYTRFRSASEKHILWLRTVTQKLIGLRGHIIRSERTDRIVPQWSLRYAKKESLKLLIWLYRNPKAPCLQRKRDIFLRFVKSK